MFNNDDDNLEQFTKGDRELLRSLHSQVKDNNKILRGMRSSARNASIFRVLKWLVLVLLGLYVWSILQPVYEAGKQTLSQAQASYQGISGTVSAGGEQLSGISAFLESLQEILPDLGAVGESETDTAQ